jgi:hypothetical protein
MKVIVVKAVFLIHVQRYCFEFVKTVQVSLAVNNLGSYSGSVRFGPCLGNRLF